jgi:hypothetical protein
MPELLERLRQSAPDLARLDPLSSEVRAWLDQAYAAVKDVDLVEGAVLRLHERALHDPRRKAVASAEIVGTLERARATGEFMRRRGLSRRGS